MDKIDELLTRRVDSIYPSRQALEKILRTGKKLRLYQGFDPSGIELHIGHMTGLMKLREFQNLGHHVIFLVGDGTGQAGDPSGKSRTREKFLTNAELRQNAKDYVMQAGKIVMFTGKNPAEILYNSDWLNKLNLVEILNIAGHFSLQYLEERDLYVERKKQGNEINFREFMYPLLQGYDSVAMNVDLELGGSDQMFNMLAGRKLVREIQKREKFVMTTPLLTDNQGKKIGKTEGNVIALTSPPKEFYGMIMSLTDDVIIKSFEMITDIPIKEVELIKKDIGSGKNPMIYKKLLAFTLTRILNNESEANKAQEYFEKTFQKRELTGEIPILNINIAEDITVKNIVMRIESKESASEVKRLIDAGGVEIDGKKHTDPQQTIKLTPGMIIKIGKHKLVKISINN